MIKQHANGKISAWNRKSFWQVFLLNAVCVFFYQLVCDVRFAFQNDQFLCHIFAGSHADNGTGYGYVNLVTGYIIKKLYLAIPYIPWYALLQYVCIFICFMMITLAVLQDNRNWGGYIVCFVFLFLLGYECYARISYTKTGSVCAAAAYFLLYQIAGGKLRKRRYLAAVFIFFVTGYLWWNFSVVLAGLIMAVPCGYGLYKSMRGENKKRGRFVLLAIVSAAAYLNENYGGYFYVSHVADMGLTQIYMIRNGDISLNTEQIREADSADIVSDVKMYVYENIMIKGSIYKKGTNSFDQKVYVEAYDQDTGEYSYCDVIQEKTPGRTDVFEGKYSAVFAETEQEENKDYAVILAIDGQMYRVPLKAIDGYCVD